MNKEDDMPETNDKEASNKKLSQDFNVIINGIKNEIELMNNFIGQNIYKAANESPDGLDKFVSENPNSKESNNKKTILGLTNSKDGYSLAATEKNTQEKITKIKTLINNFVGQNVLDKSVLENPEVQNKVNELKIIGIDIKAIENIENEIKEFGRKVREDLNNIKGATTRLNEYIKLKGITENIGIVDETGKGVSDKREIIRQIEREIKPPESVYKMGLKDITLLKPLQDIANVRAAEIFAIDKEKNNQAWCVIDRAKLTPENIDKFTKLFNNDIQAFAVIQETLSSNISIAENQKLATALLPAINKLPSEEMQEKGGQIVKIFAVIQETLSSNISVEENQKLATALLQVVSKLPSEEMQEKSSHIVKAFAIIQETLSSNISVKENQKLATILLPVVSKLPSEELQEQGNKIIKDFIPLLESNNKFLNEKAKTALNTLDPAYIAENSAKITIELKEINDKGTSLWEKFKSIFTGKDYLEERFEQSVNKYRVLSDEYVKKEINDKIFSNTLTNEQIATGLTKFMNKNIEVKEVNNLNLAEIRKANPEVFDKLLFEKQAQAPLENKSSKLVNRINKVEAGRGL